MPDNAKFCSQCGERMIVNRYCKQCGEKVALDDRYCTNCGTRLDVPQPDAPQRPMRVPADGGSSVTTSRPVRSDL